MPKGKPYKYAGGGFIQSLREKHEPHMRLAAQVDFNHNLIHGIEGKLRDLPKIHKTLSKSFGMQRKTLLRVIELEKQTDAITIIVENIQDGLEDAIDKKKRRRRRRGRPSAKRPPETPKDWDEEVPGDWDGTTGGTPEGEGEPDEAILDGDPEGAIEDPEGEGEPVIFGEPDSAIDPETDLQPIDDSEGEPEGEGEPDEAILDGDPDKVVIVEPEEAVIVEPDEAVIVEPEPEPDEVILDGDSEPEQAVIVEPDPAIDPETDLQPIDGEPEPEPDEEFPGVEPEPEPEDPAIGELDPDDDTQSGLGISEELKSIHSSISKLATHTRSVLEKVLGLEKRVSINEKKISLIKEILQAERSDIGKNISDLEPDTDEDKVKSPLSESIQNIADSTTSIHDTLIRQQDLDRAREDDTDIDDEQDKRDKKEQKGEGIGAGIQKVGKKMLAPVQSAFQKMVDWLKRLILAKAVMMFMNWFSDPANQKKVGSLFRFIKDWWPAIVTGLILFAGSMLGPTGIIIGITALIVGFIPKVVNAIKSFFGFGKDAAKEAEKGEKESNKALKGKEDEQDKLKPDDDVSKAPEPGSTPLEPPAQEFNKGGQVPGQGDKDTVPAMLTPGEFVLTKDAVQKYGVDTLEGMNAAAGGTNEPKEIRPGFKGSSLAAYGGGGSVQPNKLFGYSGGGEVKEQVEEKKESGPKLNKETGNLARRIEPLITGQEPKSPLMSLVEKHPMVMMFKGIMKNPIIQGIISNVGDALGGDKEDPELDLKKAIADLQERFNYSIYDGNYKPVGAVADGADGADGSDGSSSGGGSNPLAGFIAAISKVPLIGKPLGMAAGLLVDGLDNIVKEKVESFTLANDQKGTSTPGAPTPPTTTVAYQQAQSAAQGSSGATSPSNPGGKIPDFSASAKVDSRKVKVLGISR
tara:strand:- start:1425 stop:4169 length:2745 start_codon:yes stop_codon:yes gene_type:complete